jgi:electron transport complex protein RnfD
MAEQKLLLASSPHYATPVSAQKLMCRVIIALLPAAAWGVYLFGVPALVNILVSVAAAVLAESGFRKLIGRPVRLKDGSAVVTGLLLALVLPPSTPPWVTALGAVFAIIAAKEFFGGLGANVFNPALIGRAFLLMSFPATITTWHSPVFFGNALTDAASAATPLNILKTGADAVSSGSLHYGVNFSAVQDSLGASSYGEMLKDLFLGFRSGCTGETSILLILAGGLFLLFTRTIDWRTPLSMLLAGAVMSLLLGMDPVFGLLSGGLAFGAFFMATDYVTSPLTPWGRILFGAGAGIITVLIRKLGNYPEGVTYGILIMNALTPFLNRLIQKKYGFIPPKKGGSK